MTTHIHHLTAEEIDCSPGWLVRRQEPDAGFVSAVAKFGVVQPVLVTEREAGWLLVCGWKRVQACRRLELPVPCLPVAADDLACAEIFLHCNAEEMSSGPTALPWARYIRSRLPQKEAEEFCALSLEPLLGAKNWRCLRAWLDLDGDWDRLIAKGNVPFELGPAIAFVGPDAARDLLPVFTPWAWSLNKARQVVTWLSELAEGSARPIGEILQELKITKILHRQELSPKDAQQAVMHRVRQARFPELSRLERDFDHLRSQVEGRTGWRIQPEQHFETNGLTLQARIRSQADAEQVLSELRSIVESPELKRIWSWQEQELERTT
jgi:hypothetical protein